MDDSQAPKRAKASMDGLKRGFDAVAFLDELLSPTTPDGHLAGKHTGNAERTGGNSARGYFSASENTGRLDAAQSIIADGEPAHLDYGIGVARSYVVGKNAAVEELLFAIVHKCETGQDASHDLAVQRLQGWTELLKLYRNLDAVDEHPAQYHSAWTSLEEEITSYPWDRQKAKSFEVFESSLEVAAAFVRSGRSNEASVLFHRLAEKAEELYGRDDERLIWTTITIGEVYQRYSSWDEARPWFEQALAAALGSLGCADGVTLSLEKALEEGRYTSDDSECGHTTRRCMA